MIPKKVLLWCNSVTPKRRKSEEFVRFGIPYAHSVILVCSDICRSKRRCQSEKKNISVALSWPRQTIILIGWNVPRDTCFTKYFTLNLYTLLLLHLYVPGNLGLLHTNLFTDIFLDYRISFINSRVIEASDNGSLRILLRNKALWK